MITTPEHVYNLFFQPGEVVEIRVAGLKGEKKGVWEGRAWGGDAWVFGYFDNIESFAEAVNKLDQAGASAVYFTPNPPRPELIHRVRNRLVVADKKRTLTSNHEIKCIRWLLIDLDPSKVVRPAGISSSDEELAYAQALGKAIKEWLARNFNFPDPIGAMSGNGYHMVYRLPDLPNEIPHGKSMSEASELVKRALAAIQANFKDRNVDVDQQVFNAARIWKLYGTVARKGESSVERPHRRSHLFSSAPRTLDDVGIVTKEQLEKLADMIPVDEHGRPTPPLAHGREQPPSTETKQKSKTSKYTHEWGDLDVPKWLSTYAVTIKEEKQDGTMTKFILESCVFNNEHKAPDAMFFKSVGGPLGYKCLHDSCAGFKFKEARQIISQSDSLKAFMTGYDPSFEKKPPEEKSMGTGVLSQFVLAPSIPFPGRVDMPNPVAMDPLEFFQVTHTNRPRFTIDLMAKYLALYTAPICCTSGVFWRYANGVWEIFPEGLLHQMASQALGEKVQVEWVINSIKLLQFNLNREEKEWPVFPNMINVKNGMVNLASVQPEALESDDFDLDKLLMPHDPKYGSRVQLDVVYDLDSYTETRRWFRALNEIFPEGRPVDHGKTCLGDDKIRLLKQFAGYCLLNTVKYERCMVMYGGGANGKGTIMDTISNILGERNVTELTIEDLGKSFNLPYLQTKLLVTCAELPQRDSGTGVQKLKQCISGDIVSGELKFGRRIDFRNKAKFMFSMNLPPTISDKSYGLYRKLLILNFTRRFEEHEMERDLRQELMKEKNGIFLWMLDGAIDLIKNKRFSETDEVLKEKNIFLRNINPILMFGDECLMFMETLITPKTQIYQHYVKWCNETLHKPLGRTNFYLQMEAQFKIKSGRREVEEEGVGERPTCFLGVGIKL